MFLESGTCQVPFGSGTGGPRATRACPLCTADGRSPTVSLPWWRLRVSSLQRWLCFVTDSDFLRRRELLNEQVFLVVQRTCHMVFRFRSHVKPGRTCWDVCRQDAAGLFRRLEKRLMLTRVTHREFMCVVWSQWDFVSAGLFSALRHRLFRSCGDPLWCGRAQVKYFFGRAKVKLAIDPSTSCDNTFPEV